MELQHFEALYPEKTREKEVGKILTLIKEGKSCQVVGLAGVGRSNLLGLLSYNKTVKAYHLKDTSHWFHFVYMDFSEMRKRPLLDATKFILISLAYSLLERKLTEEYEVVNTFIKEALPLQDDLILFQALKKSIDYLAIEKELTIVLLFDRFEQYVPTLTEEFFSNLKTLRARAKYRFSCVFSLGRPLEHIIESSVFSDFFEYLAGNTIYMTIADPIGLSFRFTYIEKITGKTLPKVLQEKIVYLSNGHGKLAKACFEALLAHEGKSLEPSELLAQKPIRVSLFEIWNSLSPVEKEYIQSNFKKPIPQENITYLELVGLLNNNQITIPLLLPYITSLPAAHAPTFMYDNEKNEIVKSDTVISDQLSPFEFKLFRFLLQHKDTLCEKDVIIQTIWSDAKTREGVTDQALDQIVYRLRKKIEEDPNNPRYILTIKGRGYKFQS